MINDYLEESEAFSTVSLEVRLYEEGKQGRGPEMS